MSNSYRLLCTNSESMVKLFILQINMLRSAVTAIMINLHICLEIFIISITISIHYLLARLQSPVITLPPWLWWQGCYLWLYFLELVRHRTQKRNVRHGDCPGLHGGTSTSPVATRAVALTNVPFQCTPFHKETILGLVHKEPYVQ